MDFEYSDKVKALRERLIDFMDAHVYPIEKERDHFHMANGVPASPIWNMRRWPRSWAG